MSELARFVAAVIRGGPAIDNALAEIDRLEAENRRLREQLAPFQRVIRITGPDQAPVYFEKTLRANDARHDPAGSYRLHVDGLDRFARTARDWLELEFWVDSEKYLFRECQLRERLYGTEEVGHDIRATATFDDRVGGLMLKIVFMALSSVHSL